MASGAQFTSGGDSGPDVPPVPTPDIKARGASFSLGLQEAGTFESLWAALFAGIVKGFEIVLTILADVFDEVAALLTGFFTAAQGQDTPGFNKLVAAVLSDTLGVEVSAQDLQQAQFEGGRVAAMQRVGADLFRTLGNEFTGAGATSEAGEGVAGLPGTPGVQLTPEQGVQAAQAFLGFALSFAVRQGNVAFLSSALPWEWLGGIREYGEMMAKNLGLGRLVRRALQPYLQTLVADPLQDALNVQYRPKKLDPKQIAAAFIRDTTGSFDHRGRLALLGYSETDIDLLVEDTYTRVAVNDLNILHDLQVVGDDDYRNRVQALGFSRGDVELIRLARDIQVVQLADRAYANIIAEDFVNKQMTEADFKDGIAALRIPPLEADAITRNAAHRAEARHKHLSLSFLKRAYLNAAITLDEYLAHALELGFSQDDVDILEQELLVEQKQAADKIKAKAAKIAAKGTKKTPPPPAAPPTTSP